MAEVAAKPDVARKLKVTVIYNGVPRELEFKPNEKVHALLRDALREFGIPKQSADDLALFNAAGVELELDVSCHAAGIQAKDQLVLRPRVVRGG